MKNDTLDARFNCIISDSTVTDINISSVTAVLQSYLDPSILVDSYISNSSVRNSTIRYSRVENSTFCGNVSIWSGALLNNTLFNGKLDFNGSTYFGVINLNDVCAGVPQTPVGSLAAVPSIVKNGDPVTFK